MNLLPSRKGRMQASPYVLKKDIRQGPFGQGDGPPGLQLDLELTERCNNACIHCSINLAAGDRRARRREMDRAAWERILGEAAALGTMTVRFTGGEPLLRDDFPDLYLAARRLGMKVLLFTNARLLTPKLADLLADIPPLEAIEVSVYGMHRESYEAVTGRAGSYAQFRQGVQCLIDRKIPFVVKGALLPRNLREIPEFDAWAATIPWMEGPPDYAMFFDLRGRRDSVAKNNRIRRLRISPETGVALLARQPERYRKEMAEFFSRLAVFPGDRLFTCGIGPACVDAYGKLQPCLLLRHPDLAYDLNKGALQEALLSVFPRLREMRAADPLYLERCARCFLRGMCGQCPAKSWSEHGTLDTPVAYCCQAAHAQARFLGLVREGEHAWDVRDADERIADLKERGRAS